MKKGLIVFAVILLLIVGGVWYMLSGAGDFIRAQMEQQGSKYLGTTVSVASVDLAVTEGRMTISDLDIKNPAGFSANDAFSVDAITLDLGEVLNEPYVVQTISIDAPEILYELDAGGKGNLLTLKNNLTANLPKASEKPPTDEQTSVNPLVIVESVVVSGVRLKLNFENLNTGDLAVDTKAYDITLPTFNAGPIGQPNGLPADQIGLAVVNKMLDNVIAAAKDEAKKRLTEEAKKKMNEKLEGEKNKLLDKANDKLKDLLKKN